jgi:DNA polymerase IV
LLKKIIFLVDMNAFFIACEMSRNPALLKVPAAVAGDPEKRSGIILAANYDARAFGVKTAMTLHQARKLCPAMVTVPPDHQFYSETSRKIMHLLSCYTPCIEKNSIDEAWLDMTGTESLFGPPAIAARLIMDDIRQSMSLWCSVGISENKFLAKMASDMKKPLGITELWQNDVPVKMWPLPVEAMYGIGEKTCEKLGRLNIFTIGDLARSDLSLLQHSLGENAVHLHRKANGIDPSPVTPHRREDAKSIGRSVTLANDARHPEEVRLILMALAEDVGQTARKYGKKGTTVQITIKFADFKTITRQTTVPPTFFTRDIFTAGMHLMKSNWPKGRTVRLAGISLSGFDRQDEARQLSFFDDPSGPPAKSDPKNRQHCQSRALDEVMDRIRGKYGSGMIGRASLMKKD